MIRVGDIRKAIEGLPDDAPVHAGICGGELCGVHDEDVDIEFMSISRMGEGVAIGVHATEYDEYWDDEDDNEDDDEDLD